jgi:hypothetical protein
MSSLGYDRARMPARKRSTADPPPPASTPPGTRRPDLAAWPQHVDSTRSLRGPVGPGPGRGWSGVRGSSAAPLSSYLLSGRSTEREPGVEPATFSLASIRVRALCG